MSPVTVRSPRPMMNSTARADLVQLDAEIREDLGRDALALADQAQEQVLGADVVVVEPLRFLLRKLQHLARPLGEFVKAISHRISPSLGRSSGTEPIVPESRRGRRRYVQDETFRKPGGPGS